MYENYHKRTVSCCRCDTYGVGHFSDEKEADREFCKMTCPACKYFGIMRVHGLWDDEDELD